MSRKFNRLLDWLEKVSVNFGIETPGGQVLFKTEVFLCAILFLAFDAALIHEIISSVISIFSGSQLTQHALIYFLVFAGCSVFSMLLVFVREKTGTGAVKSDPSELDRPSLKAPDVHTVQDSEAPKGSDELIKREENRSATFFKVFKRKRDS